MKVLIRHIVLARFKPEISEDEKKEILASLKELPEKIPEILSYEVGFDFFRSDRSYDIGLASTFAELNSLSQYLKHPIHMQVAARFRSASDHMAILDMEI